MISQSGDFSRMWDCRSKEKEGKYRVTEVAVQVIAVSLVQFIVWNVRRDTCEILEIPEILVILEILVRDTCCSASHRSQFGPVYGLECAERYLFPTWISVLLKS